MHESARNIGRAFFEIYGKQGDSILDVGALDVNGNLRSEIPPLAKYIGIDICAGPNVDITLVDPYLFPFLGKDFDCIISTSCFEHDELFWLTFAEMARATKDGGFIYINAPSNGAVHRHPVDCWRFYPDAGKGLEKWARRCGYDITLLESFTMNSVNDV